MLRTWGDLTDCWAADRNHGDPIDHHGFRRLQMETVADAQLLPRGCELFGQSERNFRPDTQDRVRRWRGDDHRLWRIWLDGRLRRGHRLRVIGRNSLCRRSRGERESRNCHWNPPVRLAPPGTSKRGDWRKPLNLQRGISG